MAIEVKTILGDENGVVINDLNLANATADQKSIILTRGCGVGSMAQTIFFEIQVEWIGLNVTTDVVRVYQKLNKDSSIAPAVEDTTEHVLALTPTSGNGFIKIYPTGAEYFKVAIEGAVLGSAPTATAGTISIDYAAKQ